ncbi:MAG TPA: choice-of-anchor Q domain-containing protein, partial [Gemmataceae bacterium]|nr:choice-of-anchor Q domain-containing protein [Gemmataceae bacterium]
LGVAWSALDDGVYVVNMVPNQVSDANGSVPGGPLASFLVAVPMVITVTNTGDAISLGTLRAAISAADEFTLAPSVIVFSNTTAGGATNFYDGTTRTIALTGILPTITGSLSIVGPGSALLNISPANGGTFQLMPISPTYPNIGSISVSLSGLTLSGAQSMTGGGAIGDLNAAALTLTDVTLKNNTSDSAAGGGGIYLANGGSLTLVKCTIQSNRSNSGSRGGGGIEMYYAGFLSITDCTISGNWAGGRGGGVDVENAIGTLSTVTVTRSIIANNTVGLGGGGGLALGIGFSSRFGPSTAVNLMLDRSALTGNTAGGLGGGLYLPGEIGSLGATISNSTVAGNTADSGGGLGTATLLGKIAIVGSTITGNSAKSTGTNAGLGGGGISLYTGSTWPGSSSTVALDDTVVSGNLATNGNDDIAAGTAGVAVNVTTAYSAIGSNLGFTYVPGPGDLPVGASLNLQPLANNGGPTQTIAFATGSPLLNAGDPALANTTDQRGVPRSIGGRPDIGAYEYQPVTVANVQVNDGSLQRSEVRSITVTFSGPVSFASGSAAAAFQLTHVQTGNNVGLTAAVSTNAAGQTVVKLSFSGSETDLISGLNGGVLSLADGRYQLSVLSGLVSDAALGWSLDGNADGSPGGDYLSPAATFHGTGLRLFRLFGDANGDGVIDATDLSFLRYAFQTGTYISYLDADNSGAIDSADLSQFRVRYNLNVF